MPEGKGQHSGDAGRWWVISGLRDYESQTLLGDLGINPFWQQPGELWGCHGLGP